MLFDSRETVVEPLRKLIEDSHQPIAIQCGHFALNYDEKLQRLLPGIFQDISDLEKRALIQAHPYMGHFPLETWKMGVELAVYAKKLNKKCSLILLVNDWQWVPKAESGEENPLRSHFYASPKLPPSYLQELTKSDLTTDCILPFKYADEKLSNPYFFSETKLRKQFANHYSGTCELNNQCAQEYVPLVLQLQRDGVGLLISFVPSTCMNAIEGGTEKCLHELRVPIKIANIYANGIFHTDFWEQIELTVASP